MKSPLLDMMMNIERDSHNHHSSVRMQAYAVYRYELHATGQLNCDQTIALDNSIALWRNRGTGRDLPPGPINSISWRDPGDPIYNESGPFYFS